MQRSVTATAKFCSVNEQEMNFTNFQNSLVDINDEIHSCSYDFLYILRANGRAQSAYFEMLFLNTYVPEVNRTNSYIIR